MKTFLTLTMLLEPRRGLFLAVQRLLTDEILESNSRSVYFCLSHFTNPLFINFIFLVVPKLTMNIVLEKLYY